SRSGPPDRSWCPCRARRWCRRGRSSGAPSGEVVVGPGEGAVAHDLDRADAQVDVEDDRRGSDLAALAGAPGDAEASALPAVEDAGVAAPDVGVGAHRPVVGDDDRELAD